MWTVATFDEPITASKLRSPTEGMVSVEYQEGGVITFLTRANAEVGISIGKILSEGTTVETVEVYQ